MNARLAGLLLLTTVAASAAAELQEVANFPTTQVTGVTVSKTGRVFVNFPDWGDEHPMSVAEIVNGQPQPFPNPEWNTKGDPKSTFICVQSVVVDANDMLWVIDPAAPKMQSIVQGGPKLVKIDLKTNMVVQAIPFGGDIAPSKSYLNDVRVDVNSNTAFITDSGKGAIVVVDLTSGTARRLLDGHKSTSAEKGFKLKVNGRELLDQSKKSPPQIQSDGIALTNDGYLYYHALTGHTLYRIKSDYLKDAKMKSRDLEAKIENMGQTPAPDGMIEAPDNSVYLTNLESGGIVRFDPQTKQVTTVIEDAQRLLWPDTLSWGQDGALYVTASQIQNMPRFNDGKNSARTEPYRLFKVTGVR
jgi:sugar lactone lactonase YvrE